MELPHWVMPSHLEFYRKNVLILILMELPHWADEEIEQQTIEEDSLNPYSNGITSLGANPFVDGYFLRLVLILILMELPHWEVYE